MMLDKQEVQLLGVSIFLLAVADWEVCMLVCKLLLAFIGAPFLLLLIVVVIVQLYFAIANSIAYTRKGAAKIHTWLFS